MKEMAKGKLILRGYSNVEIGRKINQSEAFVRRLLKKPKKSKTRKRRGTK